ncbi:MAG: hypothetical protein KGH98_02495 [Candidatus Micrarchaeota archaeon]|nr:hypothetical protein [Candidatus Micrarchaeota archaeon]
MAGKTIEEEVLDMEQERRMKKAQEDAEEPSIFGPIILWVVILAAATILELVVGPMLSGIGQGAASALQSIVNYILYMPGIIVLPIIMAIWIGEIVASFKSISMKNVAQVSLVNAVYTAIIYAITIFILYIIIETVSPASPIGQTFGKQDVLPLNLIGVPVAIVIVLIPLFATLSVFRRRR